MARVAGAVLLVLLVCIGLVIFVARQQPLPPRLAMLHLTDCALPCWIGITPGVTPVEQVKARIESVYGDSKVYHISEDSPNSLDIRRLENREMSPEMIVQWIPTQQTDAYWQTISINADLDAGDAVDLLGTPSGTAVMAYQGGLVTGLFYKDTVVAVLRSRTDLPFPVTVGLHDKIIAIAFTVSDFTEYAVERWRGFDVPYNFDT
ncbi:MAG TPA: hypothetical protein VKQ72_10675 [Aggregatilineales bacterium]|nr:hypothetical protein [Aggregatilineales bacterium]